MKNAISIFLTLVLMGMIVTIYMVYGKVIEEMLNAYFSPPPEVTLGKVNEYYRNVDFDFVQNTNYFIPDDMQDLLNIYYTVLNSGKTKFTFYCPDSYKECISEIKYLANDQVTLSHINNFVHPYNSFKNIETLYDNTGKVTIKINHLYSYDDIKAVEEKVNEIEDKLYDSNLSIKDQIKVYHDYIIDNTIYDSDRSDNNIIKYKSDTAYGTLIEGYSLCGGYTDSIAIILNDMAIENYRVSSDNHVWNAVKIDDKWYNLDLTWDDPVTNTGTQLIENDFFLIDTTTLHNIEKTEHDFDEEIYSELAI